MPIAVIVQVYYRMDLFDEDCCFYILQKAVFQL